MKSIAVSKTLNSESVRELCAQLSTGIIIRVVTFGALLFALTTHSLYAQVGGDNPTGVSGIFNGNLENTGVDPWTGNATRRITDIAVAGAVGEYPLALVRTANSRAPSTTEVFGRSGGWNHNYNWILEDSPHKNDTNYPARYTVDFPDGRVETFRAVTWDSYYRVRPGPNIPAQSGSVGVRERLQPIHQQNGSLYADLILPDGGKVEFLASLRTDPQGHYYYKYKATAIIDPYGLKTTLTWENYLNNTRKRLIKVQEPAGRYLQFSYTGTNSPRISQVQEFINGVGGRTVQYSYIYCNGCSLGQVFYYGNTQSNTHWTAHYQYTGSNIGGDMPLLLKTCDDPMYAGPMKRISYEYKTGTNADQTVAVYGQVYKVRYWDGVSAPDSGAVVSTLTVGFPNANPVNRTETRGDGVTRTFIYNGAGSGYLAWASDFSNRYASQTYDQTTKYIISVMDRGGNTTDYVSDRITGNVTQIKFPSTPNDTQPPQTEQTRSTVNYTYTNSYYLNTITDEGEHQTIIQRNDGLNRVTGILYPDGGSEAFSQYNAFNQVLTHAMTTGGTESFTYDARGLKQTYKDSTNTSSNPNARYTYDVLSDRVKDVTDVLGGSLGDPAHSTSFTYNDRGQVLVTTLPKDPANNNTRYFISNAYNPDGTTQSTTDQLGHITKYEYDDYRRLKKMTPPVRGFDGDNSEHPTKYYYGANPSDNVNDYKYTDSNATWVVLPSGKTTKVLYDDNRRKQSVTVAYGTADAATTSYGYDGVGNVTSVTNPLNRNNVSALYDERNRPSSVSVAGQATTFTYDLSGRKTKVHRPNGQDTTYGDYDQMNRPGQVTATDAGTTKYTYYPGSGLLHTMQDPRLVALGRDPDPWVGYVYTYVYDGMGRKSVVGYPPDADGYRSFEAYTYDSSGRLETYQNRRTIQTVQTLHYDALNRLSYFTWNDSNPNTPRVDFGYDAASRLTSVTNINATISRGYFNDNLLRTETETAAGGVARTLNYTYDADGNRGTLGMPGYSFTYGYTGRNQLLNIKQGGTTLASYVYDLRGNITSRTLNNNTHSDYAPDARDRLTSITHALNGTTRSLNYGYYDDSNNRKWTKRDGGAGDVFGYDLNDQVIAVLLDVDNPNTKPVGDQTIFYDGSGNRTSFSPYDWLEHYTTNDLNQYPERIVTGLEDPRPSPTPRPRPTPIPRPTPPGQQLAAYDLTGNVTTGFDGSTYEYDAQNRLTRATNNGTTFEFKYDGLNRQVSRTVNGGAPTFSVWNGWDLVQEYHGQGTVDASYLYGATGLVKNLTTNRYYYQDGSGSTSHLADNTGHLLEWYWYDLQGLPCILDANNNQRTASAYNVRHLFTGQQWYSDIGLYDLRNRFYSPDIGRFLQPDPIGFQGDRTNLYRYCGNNPVTRWDPLGLNYYIAEKGGTVEFPPMFVNGESPNTIWRVGPGGWGSPGGNGGGDGGGGRNNSDNPRDHLPITPPEDIPIPLPPAMPEIPALDSDSLSSTSSQQDSVSTTVSFDLTHQFDQRFGGMGGANYYYGTGTRTSRSNWSWSGITVTENAGLFPAVNQRLTVSPRGVSYRFGVGWGVPPGGIAVTTGGQLGNTPPGLTYNFTGSISGGGGPFGPLGAAASGTWFFQGQPPTVNVGAGWGAGFGATNTYGFTIFIPWRP
jgi:RHS repeat-associated protein